MSSMSMKEGELKTPASGCGAVGIMVTYVLSPGRLSDFVQLSLEHASRTLRNHDGCEQYDILVVADDRVAFYERYSSWESFNAHQCSPSLAAFRAARTSMVVNHSTDLGRLVSDVPLTSRKMA